MTLGNGSSVSYIFHTMCILYPILHELISTEVAEKEEFGYIDQCAYVTKLFKLCEITEDVYKL